MLALKLVHCFDGEPWGDRLDLGLGKPVEGLNPLERFVEVLAVLALVPDCLYTGSLVKRTHRIKIVTFKPFTFRFMKQVKEKISAVYRALKESNLFLQPESSSTFSMSLHTSSALERSLSLLSSVCIQFLTSK